MKLSICTRGTVPAAVFVALMLACCSCGKKSVKPAQRKADGKGPAPAADVLPGRYFKEGMELPEHEPVVKAMQAGAEQALGRPVPLAGFPGGTDARFLYEGAGIPTVAAFGPGMLEVCHGPDECVPVEDIVIAAKAYALAAQQFLAGADG